jgi:antitoxin (DNA-binding transcriptional repressor) of toxin-antitoxin stability system
MHAIQVGKLKSEFSSILDKVQNDGEKYIIEYGKKHKKVAMLIPYDKSYEDKEKRTFGLLSGKIDIPDDFLEEDDQINEMFYGENQ